MNITLILMAYLVYTFLQLDLHSLLTYRYVKNLARCKLRHILGMICFELATDVLNLSLKTLSCTQQIHVAQCKLSLHQLTIYLFICQKKIKDLFYW